MSRRALTQSSIHSFAPRLSILETFCGSFTSAPIDKLYNVEMPPADDVYFILDVNKLRAICMLTVVHCLVAQRRLRAKVRAMLGDRLQVRTIFVVRQVLSPHVQRFNNVL